MDTSRTQASLTLDSFLAQARPGDRVTVRRRLSDSERSALAGTLEEGTTLTDVVGTITDRDETGITLETRRGNVRVNLADITLGKVIPPAPTRRQRPTPHGF